MYVAFSKEPMRGIELPPMQALDGTVNSSNKTLKAGKPLFHEGDKAELVYQIVEGIMRTSKLQANGKRQIISFGYPGDIVGLSPDQVYHYECEAILDVKLRAIRKNAGTTRYENEPAICDLFLHHAAVEMANMQEHFMMLGCKSATEKIASFLLSLGERYGERVENNICFKLPMKRADIADFLGVTIETVSRTMTKFRKAGMIHLADAHTVCIVDMAALKISAEAE